MMQKPKFYLSYGANCNNYDMKERAPSSIPVGIYRLENFKLAFNHVADIRRSDNDVCICGLWLITEECENALDMFEGYPVLYTKKYIKLRNDQINPFEWVNIKDNLKDNDTTALLYTMNNNVRYSPPNKYYVNTMVCMHSYYI